MKIVIAIDSMKGSMSSMEAGQAAADGILRAIPDADSVVRPLADGGEGTAEAVTRGMGGEMRELPVTGPLGTPVAGSYGIIAHQDADGTQALTAVIEVAAACGLPYLKEAEKDPLRATTFGVGELIRDAVEQGCRRFLIGLGGSATNDGGAGMLQALGFGLLDEAGQQIPQGAAGLAKLATVSTDAAMPELADCTFRIACDVTNPLLGPQGASAVFGPQKGADPEMVQELDSLLAHFAEATAASLPEADDTFPGTGAAGGLGYAFLAYLGASLESGVGLVLEETRLEDDIRGADLVVTGEGRLDAQTVMGKAPSGAADLAKKYGIPVIAFAGSVTEDAGLCNTRGIDAFFPILRRIQTLEEAMQPENAKENLRGAAEQALRLWAAARGK